MKRIFTVLLAVTLLLGTLTCLPLSVSAATEGDFEYEVFEEEAFITKYVGKGGDVTIPSTLGGYPVTIIGESAFQSRTDITNINIPYGVKGFSNDAFEGCTSLTSIDIPDSVESIWVGAFYGCTGLTSIEIPDSVRSIGYSAFNGCSSLTSVTIGSGVTSFWPYVFNNCGSLTSITVSEDNPKYYSSGNCVIYVFEEKRCLVVGCAGSVIPDDVTEIWEFAFFGCTGLTSIEIPESVKGMDTDIFGGCDSLTDIYCLAPEKPGGWSDSWLGDCTATVHWGTSMPSNPETPTSILGDLGGNGKIDSNDYMLLKRYCLGSFNLTEEQLAVADINKDGRVNSVDYMLLKRVVLGTYEIV